MDLNTLMLLMLALMLALILFGIHIGFALGMTALLGSALIFRSLDVALGILGGAAYDVLRGFVFATIPLFILMGDFVAKSGAAKDLYRLINIGLKRLPGRLAVATVLGNAVFAAVTGVSIAAAAAFSRIAYPQMVGYGYDRRYALGAVAGSSSLGMLIPPSILLIIWGIVTEISIGKLFLAGIVPGLLLTALFVAYNVAKAATDPTVAPPAGIDDDQAITGAEIASGLGILALIVLVIGGIWGGLFTPTEAAGIGALGAMVLAIIKGARVPDISRSLVDAAKTTAPILFLILAAAMYSRFLALGGIVAVIGDAVTQTGLGPTGAIAMMIVIWLLLGMLMDSSSIILLTVPIFWPIAQSMGLDPLAFAIAGILVIEAGLLTPPFGLLVYTVKETVDDNAVTLAEIFRGSVPYWLLILAAAIIILIEPRVASWLPAQL